MNTKTPITVAYGDGIGPEIMQATLDVLEAAGARLQLDIIEVGEKVYRSGVPSGIADESWATLRRNKIFLKAPITTPQGGGFKSLNVTIRKTLGLYANVRHSMSYSPFVQTKHPGMDVVIIRENEEDLYGGIEHRQTTDVYQCLKLISRPGCEKIIRYAFNYARAHNRKKVSAFTKDKLMEFTDGFFHQIFREVAAEYPEIGYEHQNLDIGTAKLANHPTDFDVVVIPNLYGDILSDVVAQITTGSIGLGGSANVGDACVMFEAIHGSAPMIAGQDLANPSGLLLAAVMMLAHINQPDIAETVHNAWLKTIEDGYHTGDIYREGHSQHKVGCKAFTAAVIERLGQEPQHMKPVRYYDAGSAMLESAPYERNRLAKSLQGVDVFVEWDGNNSEALGLQVQQLNGNGLKLQLITNMGVVVWPERFPETHCTDHWHCRFVPEEDGTEISHAQIVDLLNRFEPTGLDVIKIENLYQIQEQPAYST